MLKLLWPLLIVNLKISDLIWWETVYFFQNKTTIILPGDTDELGASCHAGRRRPISGAKLEAWSHKMFHIFHFLPSDMVWAIVKPLASDKSCLISMPFMLTYIDVRIRMQGARKRCFFPFPFPSPLAHLAPCCVLYEDDWGRVSALHALSQIT